MSESNPPIEGEVRWPESTAAAEEQEIHPIDLTGRERQLRAAVAAMEKIVVTFCRGIRKGMPFLTRYRAQVVPGPVAIVDASSSSLEAPTLTLGLASADGLGWAAIAIDRQVISMLLEAGLGGRGAFWETPVEAPITTAQRALLLRVLETFAQELSQAVSTEVGITLVSMGLVDLGSNQSRGADALTVPCAIDGLPAAAVIQVSIGAQALQAAARDQENESPMTGDARIAQGLMEVPLQMVVELGRMKIDVRRVLNLKVGDVLRLNTATDDPVSVCIGGLAKFAGAPMISRGQLAVELRGRHET